jgi:hypothetical protein
MWSVIGELMYEIANLQETIRYCRSYNRILRDLAPDEIESRFWNSVEETVGSFRGQNLFMFEDRMIPVFNAWFVVNLIPDELQVPLEEGCARTSHMINFFVRMGRQPAMSIA